MRESEPYGCFSRALVEAAAAMAVRYAVAVAGIDEQTGDDIAQEIRIKFVRIGREEKTRARVASQEEGSTVAFANTVAARTAKDAMRKAFRRSRRECFVEEITDEANLGGGVVSWAATSPPPDQILEAVDLRDRLVSWLISASVDLSPREREALHYAIGLKREWSGTSRSTLNTYRARARAKLKEAKPPWLGDEHLEQLFAG